MKVITYIFHQALGRDIKKKNLPICMIACIKTCIILNAFFETYNLKNLEVKSDKNTDVKWEHIYGSYHISNCYIMQTQKAKEYDVEIQMYHKHTLQTNP